MEPVRKPRSATLRALISALRKRPNDCPDNPRQAALRKGCAERNEVRA